jgi:hypothetical protein
VVIGISSKSRVIAPLKGELSTKGRYGEWCSTHTRRSNWVGETSLGIDSELLKERVGGNVCRLGDVK